MLKRFWVKGFRNLTETVLQFGVNPVVILGENGQGKSNFLESIYVASNGCSPIEDQLDLLVGMDQEALVLGLDYTSQALDYRVYFKVDQNQNRVITLNQQVKKSYSAIHSSLWTEFISSDICRLYRESPDQRRKDLDRFIGKIDPNYRRSLVSYERVVRQKNQLLKNEYLELTQLAFWNDQLVTLASTLVETRKKWLKVLEQKLKELALQWRQEWVNELELAYQHKMSGELESEYVLILQKKISQNQEKERQAKHALYGPHREDYEIRFDGRIAHQFLSRGLHKVVTIWLKWAQFILIEEKCGKFPILLLDDPFAEMDAHSRRIALADMQTRTQILYTTILDSDQHLFENARMVMMTKGQLSGHNL